MRISIRLTLLFCLFLFSSVAPAQTLEAFIDGPAADHQFGATLAISDDGLTCVIGAPYAVVNGSQDGYVKVFKLVGNNWVQYGPTLERPTTTSIYNFYGNSVSISADGSRAAIGCPDCYVGSIEKGIVRVFDLSDSTLTQIGAEIAGNVDNTGVAVALNSDGTRLVVGANNSNGVPYLSDCGEVRVYEDSSGTWVQIGVDLYGEGAHDVLGTKVAISANGNRIAVAAPGNDANGLESGHVRVFEWIGGSWTQLGSDIDGEGSYNYSGSSLSMSDDGNRIAIGGPTNIVQAGTNAGHVRVYEYSGGSWIQIGPDIEGQIANHRFGQEVALSTDGTRVVVGSSGYSSFSGRASVFDFNGSTWNQLGNVISGYGVGISLDQSGDGSRVIFGTFSANTPSGLESGKVWFYQVAVISGMETIRDEYVQFYPNPFGDQLWINSGIHENVRLVLTDLSSRSVIDQHFFGATSINTDFLAKGVYIYDLRNEQGESIAKGKVIRN